MARLIQRDLSEMFQQECKEYHRRSHVVRNSGAGEPGPMSYAKSLPQYLPFGTGRRRSLESLAEKNKSIRFILGKKVGKQMRIVPELRFFVDDSLDYIDKIDELLK